MIKELAARVQRIKPSPTLAVSARADELIATGKDIINLGVGEPDFDTPDFIKQAAITAIQQGFTKYTAVDGISGLKQAIIKKFARDNQLTYAPNQILVSCGAKHSLYNLFAAVLNADDEVIIPAPYWVSYPDIAKLADAVPVTINTDINQQFKITPAQLKAAITPQTRLVVLNSPSNPAGVAYTAAELTALGQILLQHPSLLIVSDDIYEHTLWTKASFTNILITCPQLHDRCIIVNGASKAYAMTGWRIGYAAGPAHIIAAMKKIQSQSTSSPTSIAQVAAEAALNGDQTCITTMTNAYKERHDFVINELRKMPGIACQPCDGTFYIFPSVKAILQRATEIKNDLELADYLLQEAGIAVVPGSAFGTPGYIRISYATSMKNLQEAMRRMKAALEKI
ncbi:MAG: Aspartate aminotransferase [Gammaproteobacteria bacterium]|jgi:aspartate aminotransferase|nr:Aspartate aminotransferase [Gammaproteobacteria bacterium]